MQSTQNPFVDSLLIIYLWICELLSVIIGISLTGSLQVMAFSITIILGVMNFTIVFPKFLVQIKNLFKK